MSVRLGWKRQKQICSTTKADQRFCFVYIHLIVDLAYLCIMVREKPPKHMYTMVRSCPALGRSALQPL